MTAARTSLSTATSSPVRSTLLALALAGTAAVAPLALLTADPVDRLVDLPPVAAPLVGFPTGTAGSALELAGGTAGSATTFAGGTTAAATTTAASVVDAALPAVTGTTHAAVELATDLADDVVETAVGIVEHGTVTACPGAPVQAGVDVRPGDLVVLRAPLSLRTPRSAVATATGVVDGVEVGLPSAGTLLSDPASVDLHGSPTTVTVSTPLVQEVLDGTSVGLPSASTREPVAAVGSDVGTATDLAPELEVRLGDEQHRMTADVLTTTAGLGGPLSVRLGTGGSGCTAVDWTITR